VENAGELLAAAEALLPMRTLMKIGCRLLPGSALVLIAAAAWAASPPSVGDPAPAWKLQGSDGRTYQLTDFRGKQAVVIAWFPKAFTPGCTKECTSLRENSDALRKLGVAFFPASVDDVATNRRFAESLGLDVPILCDPTFGTARAFGVFKEEARVAERRTFYIGKDGRIAFIDQEVKPASHGADVAAKLKELGLADRP
jgi:thioredoxin-dependent peroxiredoxin